MVLNGRESRRLQRRHNPSELVSILTVNQPALLPLEVLSEYLDSKPNFRPRFFCDTSSPDEQHPGFLAQWLLARLGCLLASDLELNSPSLSFPVCRFRS